jgi:integrase
VASVFKKKRDRGNRMSSWYYAYVDADGVRRTEKGCPDRAATEAMARKAESEAELRRRGVIDAKMDALAAHQARPLSEQVDAWRDALLHEGNTPKHADQTADRVRRLIAVMFGARPDDIDGKTMKRAQQEKARENISRLVARARLSDLATERVQAALATFRDSGRSAQTCNHYRAGIRAFARWAWRTGRLRENPLVGLAGYNAKEDRRHDRRTLSLEELTRLIAVAERGPDFQAMTGKARSLVYRLAASSGLRFSDIASIRPASFDWKAALRIQGQAFDLVPGHGAPQLPLQQRLDQQHEEIKAQQGLNSTHLLEEDGGHLEFRLQLLEPLLDHRLSLVRQQQRLCRKLSVVGDQREDPVTDRCRRQRRVVQRVLQLEPALHLPPIARLVIGSATPLLAEDLLFVLLDLQLNPVHRPVGLQDRLHPLGDLSSPAVAGPW